MRRFATTIVVCLLLLAVGVGAAAGLTPQAHLSAVGIVINADSNQLDQATAEPLGTLPAILATDVEVPAGATDLPTRAPAATAVAGAKIRPPLTLDELTNQYPDLKTYLDKVKDIKVGDMDFSEFYNTVAKIYTEKGASGVATFLQDSGLLTKLGIPLSYLDLLHLADQGGMDAVITEARKRKIITDKDELDGYLVVDSPDNVAAVKTSITDLGVTAYDYDPDTGEIRIGVPLSLIKQFGTPSALIKFLVTVGTIPHVTSFRAPIPSTETTRKF